jgi:hypothetical protein
MTDKETATTQALQNKTPLLEKFGLVYLTRFRKHDLKHNVFDFNDAELKSRVDKIERKGIILSSFIGILCVFPTVWVSVHFVNANFITYWSWFLAVTIVAVAIEFYTLFIIALKAVFEVSELINMHAKQKYFLKDGVFSVQHILARTALELPDPELKILGIDPFERISKKNLFILGLLYKAKIVVTNVVLKYALRFTVGMELFGVSILYEALPVEAFWNGVVLKRVVHEARLRLFGFALANHIADNIIHDKLLQELSSEAKIGSMRAIGNAVVMAQSYHPNMIILLLRFQQLLKIEEEHQYDDWNLFLETLQKVNKKERHFLRSLFTIAAAFDGRLSHLEEENLKAAYGDEYTLFYPRIMQLTEHLRQGKLNAALELCNIELS